MQEPDNQTLAKQLSRAFMLFGVLVAAAFLATAVSYALSWSWLTPEFEQSWLAVAEESAAHAAMLDEESSLRAFLLLGDVRYREAYIAARAVSGNANRTLVAHVGADLSQKLIETRLTAELWRVRWAQAVMDSRPLALRPSQAEGTLLFDAYREKQSALALGLALRNRALYRREQQVVGLRVAIVLVVCTAIFFFAVRQHRALRNSIVLPVATLLRQVARVCDGDLEATLDPVGPSELRRLGEGLNKMVGVLAGARDAAQSRDAALHAHSVRLRQILEASREFSESLNLAYVVRAVRESTAAVGGYERVIVWLMDDLQKRLVDSEDAAREDGSPPSVESENGLAERAAKSGRITFELPGRKVRFGNSNLGPVCAISIPLIVGARVVGALEVRHSKAQVATLDVLEVIEMLATHAATAIESARLHAVIEERSQTDGLTNLYNRRRMDGDLDTECKRCARYNRPLAFVMLDVDQFKAFNDTHGHPTADRALRDVAAVITSCLRATDTAYRYGGEEFAIMLRESCAADAMMMAERLRSTIEQHFASGSMAGVTASFGVAELGAEASTAGALIEAADAAMYASKNAGRNRVMLSSHPPSRSLERVPLPAA